MAEKPGVLSRITPLPTLEEIKKFRAESGYGLHETKRILTKSWIERNIENCFTVKDVRIVMREMVKLI